MFINYYARRDQAMVNQSIVRVLFTSYIIWKLSAYDWAFLAEWPRLNRVVHDIVVGKYKGSISAEHGIGLVRREELRHYKSAVELDLMRRVKAALDPQGLMNPGKIL